jgi:hypothetical protein
MLRMCVCGILTSSRITRSGSWKTDPPFLTWFYHSDLNILSTCMEASVHLFQNWGTTNPVRPCLSRQGKCWLELRPDLVLFRLTPPPFQLRVVKSYPIRVLDFLTCVLLKGTDHIQILDHNQRPKIP